MAWPPPALPTPTIQGGLASTALVLYDVTTLYFETDQGDAFREQGFCTERRLESQITVGLLTDAAGFLLMVKSFEGDKAPDWTSRALGHSSCVSLPSSRCCITVDEGNRDVGET